MRRTLFYARIPNKNSGDGEYDCPETYRLADIIRDCIADNVSAPKRNNLLGVLVYVFRNMSYIKTSNTQSRTILASKTGVFVNKS